MHILLPPISVLVHLAESQTDMYVDPSGHYLYVNAPSIGLLLFVVEENLNEMDPAEVNRILQRELLT